MRQSKDTCRPPISACDRSTNNLSSYKSLHHTAHVPNLLRGSTHVPPRRWWACGAWYGREVQHNSRDTMFTKLTPSQPPPF
ncbi:hypothetical protein HZ326_24553 [Fusarium oxysporum f. sp. albedinis]|nr:hypothetical protein HZ326_24553 [Fusarium oxysporum f. sp. albedinis]